MGNMRVMIQLKPEAAGAVKCILEEVKKCGGKNLPAQPIIPPIVHFSVPEDTWALWKVQYDKDILRTIAEEKEQN